MRIVVSHHRGRVPRGVPGRSAHLKLLKPSPPALQALKQAGFDMFLEIHADLSDAVAFF